jgi:hypothetical protein
MAAAAAHHSDRGFVSPKPGDVLVGYNKTDKHSEDIIPVFMQVSRFVSPGLLACVLLDGVREWRQSTEPSVSEAWVEQPRIHKGVPEVAGPYETVSIGQTMYCTKYKSEMRVLASTESVNGRRYARTPVTSLFL